MKKTFNTYTINMKQKRLFSAVLLIAVILVVAIFVIVTKNHEPESMVATTDPIYKYKHLMDSQTYSLIMRQYKAHQENSIPKVADPEIKSIPIRESGESLIDIRTDPHNPRIKMDDGSRTEIGSKMRATVYHKLDNMIKIMDELAPTFGFKPDSIVIKVEEGLRSIRDQERYFNLKVNEIRTEHPEMSEEASAMEASKWISPVQGNTPVHTTGGAVDFRLWNLETNSYVDLGVRHGGSKGPKPTAPTFSKYVSKKQQQNRLFLLIAATRAGLVNYPFEFWHYSSGDRYAVYWLESDPAKREAKYDAVR